MSQLSELVLAKRAEVEARLRAEWQKQQDARARLDFDIHDAGLWRGLDVPRPEHKISGNDELVYRVTVTIASKPYDLKIVVKPSASATIGDEARAEPLYVASILDVETTIERLAGYLQ